METKLENLESQDISFNHERVFGLIALIYLIAPLIGELAIYLGAGFQVSGSLPSSICISFVSTIAYIWFRKTGEIKAPALILAIIQPALFTWGLMYSGGIRAEHIIYVTFFPIVNGFFLGRRAAGLTTLYCIALLLLLSYLEGFGLIPRTEQPLITVAMQSIACLTFIGWLVMVYEKERVIRFARLMESLNSMRNAKEELERNEIKYKAVTEAMGEGLVIRNSSGEIIHHNHAALEILELTAEQLAEKDNVPQGWSIIQDNGAEFPHESYPAEVALRTQQRVRNVKMGLNLPNDRLKWILVNSYPAWLSDKLVTISTFSDVSEFIRTKYELNYILRALKIGVWTYNLKNDKLTWDQSFYELLEADPKDFSNEFEAWESLCSEESKAHAAEAFKQSVSTGKDLNITYEITTPKGNRKYIGASGTIVRNEHNEPSMMFGLNWDRTEEVKFAQEVEKQRSLVEQERAKSVQSSKMASLGEISAGIAHEINNPLAVILGQVSLLATNRNDPEKFQSRVESIFKSTRRIEKIVNGLRKFSRSSQAEPHKPCVVSDLIFESLVLIEGKAIRERVAVELDLNSTALILCDSIELEQVVVNLISNSIDAAKLCTERWVRIRTFDDGPQAVIQIIDSGAGITSEQEEKLFQPFYTTKPVGEGTGLGLSIAKGIVESHKGQIFLNKKESHTCFEVRLAAAGHISKVSVDLSASLN